MAACKFFSWTLFTSSFQGKLLLYEIFSRQKSLFVLLGKEKNACRSAYLVPMRKFYSFHVLYCIERDRLWRPWTGLRNSRDPTKHTFPSSSFLGRLCTNVCGFSLLNPLGPMLEKMTKNSVCVSSGHHKGRFASKRRLSVLKNLARASEEKSQKKTKWYWGRGY